jgi:hypothetical protein
MSSPITPVQAEPIDPSVATETLLVRDDPKQTILPQLKIGVTIVAIMAIGALVVSSIVLDRSLALIGFCLALSMATFIGMPLILAAIGDATASDATH